MKNCVLVILMLLSIYSIFGSACNNCGTEYELIDRFCSQCGRYLEKDKQGDKDAVPALLLDKSKLKRIAVLPFIGKEASEQEFSREMMKAAEKQLKEHIKDAVFIPAKEVDVALRKARRKRTDVPYSSSELEIIASLLNAHTIFSGTISHLSAGISGSMTESVYRVRAANCMIRYNIEGLVYDHCGKRMIFTKTVREKYFDHDEEHDALEKAMKKAATDLFETFTLENLSLWRPDPIKTRF